MDEVAKYDDAKDWLKEVLHHVYVTGNVQLFEDAIEELCAIFEVKLPKTHTKFQKKRSELFDFAVQLTQDYARNHNQIRRNL